MPLRDWISNYPRVQALLQRPDEVLDYAPDSDPPPSLEALLEEVGATLRLLQRQALERALHRLVANGYALEGLMLVYLRVPGVLLDECYITQKQASVEEQ